MIGLNFGTFIPIAAVVFLLVLSAMEYVAKFEITRTNKILGTEWLKIGLEIRCFLGMACESA
jgi:hypothetical protein